jgi:hypothetical protein
MTCPALDESTSLDCVLSGDALCDDVQIFIFVRVKVEDELGIT